MAKTLQQAIQEELSRKQTPQELGAGMADTGVQAQQILGAGKAGKAVEGSRMSSLGEQAAVQQTSQALGQVAQEGQIKALQQKQQGEEQQQAGQLQMQEIKQKANQFRVAADRERAGLLQQRDMAVKELDFNKRKAVEEQIGFLERLKNEQYVTALQQNGARARLDNEFEFKNALQEQFYKGSESLLKDNFKFKSMLDADQRQFNQKLAQMDLDTAMAVLQGDIAAQQQGAFYGALGSGVSAGISAWDKWDSKKEKE